MHLKELVIKHMLHGPHTQNSPCYNVVQNSCSKKFPKEFCNCTEFEKNGFPKYRRRNNTHEQNVYNKQVKGNNILVDNSMVVPYNSYLLRKYQCHINVEYCASIMSTKYIHKYFHKGHDRALIQIKKKNYLNDEIYDEISDYIDSRYISGMEAAWRIQEIPLHGRSHAVILLVNQQKIIFEKDNERNALLNYETTLSAWFKLNKTDVHAKQYKYINIPEHYTFDKTSASEKKWKKRQNKCNTIGRLAGVMQHVFKI